MLFKNILLALACTGILALGVSAESWKKFTVQFDADPIFDSGPEIHWSKKGREAFTNGAATISIPADMGEDEVIRGVMYLMRDLEPFAHKNRIATYHGHGVKAPYGGPHQTMLDAAAKATGHPEIRHAGAILQGLSNRGRFMAHYAHFYPERVIAVILDHSWCSGEPIPKTDRFQAGQLPTASGVPFFLNGSQQDLWGGYDRRSLHYDWAVKAFNRFNQPVTPVISIENVNHWTCGRRDLQAVWLEEVMALRVPAVINPKGEPYELIDVDPSIMGGQVAAILGDNSTHTFHDKVEIGPAGFKKQCSWWVPGPRSAGMIVDWVKQNGGQVLTDRSSDIAPPQ